MSYLTLKESHRVDSQYLLSLIVPTKNEQENISPLHLSLTRALSEIPSEVIFVDDSADATSQRVMSLAWDKPVTMIRRLPEEQAGGLSTAILLGMSAAKGIYIGTMDADLQHPPELIPSMLDLAIGHDRDIVIASRFTKRGRSEGLNGLARKIGSKGTAVAIQFLFPNLSKVSDPSSGFFLLHRRVLEGSELRPQGYKTLLEILVNAKWNTLEEVPYEFGERNSGESKLTTKEAVTVVRHILRLLR